MNEAAKLVLHEAQDRPNTSADLSEMSNCSAAEVDAQISALNRRLRASFGGDSDPIHVSASGSWRAEGVAGLLRINRNVELEIVPKFLEPDEVGWRADFFLLAVLVNTGHLLEAEEIATGIRDRGDLATLVARALLRMSGEGLRRPIRKYHRASRWDFSLDGDVNWETLVLPDDIGFQVERLELSARNAFNGVVRLASDTLADEVGDDDTRNRLRRLSRRLGRQDKPVKHPGALPQRSRGWQSAYELSRLVVDGKGLDLEGGSMVGPGFVLSTWSAWQTLCEEVLRRSVPDLEFAAQPSFILGKRGSREVVVRPDIAVLQPDRTRVLFDAKYKTRIGRYPSIASSDVYEAMAFLRAARSKRLFLLYPAVGGSLESELGSWQVFDSVEIGDLLIQGVMVEVKGMATKGGFQQLVKLARNAMESIVS